MKKKRVLIAVAVTVFTIVGIHIVSMLTVDRQIHYTEREYVSDQMDASLDGYVIALVTDTHATPAEELEKVAEHINERGVNLLLLGGT